MTSNNLVADTAVKMRDEEDRKLSVTLPARLLTPVFVKQTGNNVT